ncbi:trigger factor [Leptothermofonsia sichuanensis E412]|uniref:trigger factor n=1 Tax=Leptothermofonsia sichuanensis TaxID=2917832 RepID=UPI001CA6213F|nr:trigger factor [Leptothermofonsia sichuanensis]QZZ20393.1 trigger factor [Leptothermofonsia sichuanensis E412]
MKVTQERLPASQIGLEIEITSEMTRQAYEKVIQKYTRTANIPGFRKGKVPRQVLIQRFGALQLKAAALEDLIDDSLKSALNQEKIDALGNFQLRSSFEELVTQYEPGSPLTFSASVDVEPEVTIGQYQGLQIQAEEIKPDPERVDRVLEQYREQVATLIPVEGRPAQLKDVGVVDYKGVLISDDPAAAPEEFPGGEAEDFKVELDESKFIPGFVEGIVGMALGETKDITLDFPADYPQETLAGRKVKFTITLKELKEKELPDLDDDFAQEVSEYETLAELRASLEKRYQEEADEKTAANKEQAILNELLKQVEVDLPETLIDRELNYMINQTAIQLQNQGLDIRQLFTEETIPLLKERSRPDAINRLKRTLALGEIAKREEITVEPEEVTRKVEEILAELGDDRRNVDRDRLRNVVSEDLLREKIVDWLLQHSTVELVPEGTLTPAEDTETGGLASETLASEALESTGASDATDKTETTIAVSPETAVIDVAATETPETLESEAAKPADETETTAGVSPKATVTDAPVKSLEPEPTKELAEAPPPKPKKTTKKASGTGDETNPAAESPSGEEPAPRRKSTRAKSKASGGE